MLLGVLELAVALLLTQTPQHRLFQQPNLPRDSFAFFEAFPGSGAGASAVCSTISPTDARGGAVSGARASAGMCTAGGAGLRSTSIAPADLTSLSTNVVRLEYDADGVLGVRCEGARTNSALQSENLPNAAWNGPFGCSGVLTGNAGIAPDGTRTADRFRVLGTTTTGRCIMYQSIATAGIASAFVRGCIAESDAGCAVGIVSSGDGGILFADGGVARQEDGGVGSGVIDVAREGTSSDNACGCTYNALTWSRCAGNTNTSVGTMTVGNDGLATACGSGTRSPQDVMFWGEQSEGGFATSYSPTTAAATTRAADIISFAVTLSGATFSAGVSYNTPSALTTNATAFQIYKDANNHVDAYVSAAGKLTCDFVIGGVTSTVTSAASITASAVNRTACTYAASVRSACVGGACTTAAGALTMFTGASTFYGGTRSATGNEANGIISRWCYEFASETRCVQ